jgi:hypothetical protein
VNAKAIAYCGSAEHPCTIEADAHVSVTDGIRGSNIRIVSAEISDVPVIEVSEFELLDGAQLSVGSISTSAFTLQPGTVVTASAGIPDPPPGVTQSPKWTINQGQVTVGDFAHLWGDWELNGAPVPPAAQPSVEFAQMRAEGPEGITFALAGGASLRIDGLPSSLEPAEGCPFPGAVPPSSGAPNVLLYEGHGNVFSGGSAGGTTDQVAYFGNGTGICSGGEGSDLLMDLTCGLRIAGKIAARACWDTVNVDVKLERVPATSDEQVLELISPDYTNSNPAGNVVFADVECNGQFRDLEIVETAQACAPVRAIDLEDNQPDVAIENGFFRHVTLGAGRTLDFAADAGCIYYDPNYGCSIAGTTQRDGQTVDWHTVIRPAPRTRFGDWNGDCIWSNGEMARLQQAIAGGPSLYDPLLDVDCDGVLTTETEMARFLFNYANQPPPECSESLLGGGGMEESGLFAGTAGEGAAGGEPDLCALAAFLIEHTSPEDLAAFIAAATVTAAEHADDAIGGEITELLAHLE